MTAHIIPGYNTPVMSDAKTLLQSKTVKNKPATVSGIAESLGLSPSTVSFVLTGQADKRRVSPKTADRVRETAKRLHYVPNMWAQSLRRQRTGVVSILLGSLEHGWAQHTVIGAEGVLNEHDYNYIISIHHWDHDREEQELELLLKRKDEGIICQPVLRSRENYYEVIQHNIPLVLLDILPDMPGVSYVTWDSGPAAKVVVEHLISIGRRRIGFVGAKHYSLMTTARHRAYQQTIEEAGFENRQQLQCLDLVFDENSEIVDTSSLRRMIENEKPDALFCLNDAIALKTVQLLSNLGIRVPDDIAIAGMGDLPISHDFAAGLTTVREPIPEVGQASAEVLIELINNPQKGPIQKLIKSNDLKIRRSTVG